jgi:hypothetical protein
MSQLRPSRRRITPGAHSVSEQRPWREPIEARLAEALELSRRSQEVAARAALLRGAAHNADGSVRVVVEHHGFVEQVLLTDRARDLGREGLAAEVLTVTQDAIADLQVQLAPLLAQVLPSAPVDLTETSLLDDLDAVLRGTLSPGHVR